MDGIGKGFMSFGSSMVSGITGVVTKPIEGAKENSAKGFFKGVGTGLSGLITKPVAGAVDIVTKTSQGIQSDMTDNIECITNNFRMRPPRAFYNEMLLVREFNPFDAKMYGLLRSSLKRNSAYLGGFFCGPQFKEYLIVSNSSIHLVDANNKLKWEVDNYRSILFIDYQRV